MKYEEAVQRLEESGSAQPSSTSWGARVFCEEAFGQSTLHWFATTEELLQSLTVTEPSFYIEDQSALAAKIDALQALAGEPAFGIDEATRERLNAMSKGMFQVAWWGPASELLDGDTSHAQEVRTQFREDRIEDPETEEAGDGPIAPDEHEAFLEALACPEA